MSDYITTIVNEIENLLSAYILSEIANHILFNNASKPTTSIDPRIPPFNYKDYEESVNIGQYLSEKLKDKKTYKFSDSNNKLTLLKHRSNIFDS